MKKIIIGLGNPGPRYVFTRHNVGFLTVDRFVELNKRYIDYKKISAKTFEGFETNEYVIVKPITYMNLSGQSLFELKKKYGEIEAQNIIVVYDDVELDLGKMRIRPKGSAGGHNGVKSIIGALNSDDFARIRIGVNKKPPYMDLADYVLSEFSKNELENIYKIIDPACEALEELLNEDVQNVMNKFNGKNFLDA
ncbi:MAG: peptidyl-tRNA hydrolase, family [Oceanotoga sp.]|jgi:PTH1 family peptidyl-tRNA hydrolase|uniref:Peptidyl-tRNA hydrolase n=1 Tax=Oceanotoga teriensis TaxID=515440 RepID=A0AA45HJ91_9BACT|nr:MULTISPECIES: aminoacyl-tRNA hydrolase [Oceanotoga]MDN5341271.1 peptidyl-tRNA hydrolase, family [Oceanotoga sp.]PWJ95696.1 PTH1 family peptidyl-tRNA hydrolase [Oceanotoga teriensis]